MKVEEIDAIPRKEARQLLAQIPLGRGFDDRLVLAVEQAMNLEWWRGYHAAKRSGVAQCAPDETAREVVTKWINDCGGGIKLTFVQSELLQERIREVLPPHDLETNGRVPLQLTGCLHPGNEPLSCQYEGRCQSVSCDHHGKTWYGPRMTLEAQDPNLLYPKETT